MGELQGAHVIFTYHNIKCNRTYCTVITVTVLLAYYTVHKSNVQNDVTEWQLLLSSTVNAHIWGVTM